MCSSPTPGVAKESSVSFCAAVWAAAKGAGPLWLLSGIAIALVWINVDHDSYEYIVGSEPGEPHYAPFGNKAVIFDHPVTFHFLVNDIFMVFFFGLAAKEVTEACLPGGSLSSPRKALSPLIATVGGVLGPISVFVVTVHLLYGSGAFADYPSSVALDARQALKQLELDSTSSKTIPVNPILPLGTRDGEFSWEQSWWHHVGTEHDGVPDSHAGHAGHRQRRLLFGLDDAGVKDPLGDIGLDGEGLRPPGPLLKSGEGIGLEESRRRRELALTGRRKSTKKKGEVSKKNVQIALVNETLGFPELVHGWGVPTATDISLAWVIAMQVFPKGHPAIEFLLLLAVADDAIGLGIIAIAYPDPHHPVDPVWMLLILVGVVAAYTLRRLSCMRWSFYVLLGGFPAWVGLIKAALHPALALVAIVPFMPSECPAEKLNDEPEHAPPGTPGTSTARVLPELSAGSCGCTMCNGAITCLINFPLLARTTVGRIGHVHPPLHAFEHALKVPVEIGMFFFTLANAGVQLNGIGPLTIGVFAGLAVGKMVGITMLVLLASVVGIAPIPDNMTLADVLMVSAVASVGLTVALFVSGEAYEHEQLQAESKLGALLSGGMGILCVGVSKLPLWPHRRKTNGTEPLSKADSSAVVTTPRA